jgi:EmrB/QacA subfamily drug resistance transporter
MDDLDNRMESRWPVLLAVGIGTFMSALDGSVVNTILPLIRTMLKSDIVTIEWVVTIYLLVVSGLLLTFGRLGDIYGHKSLYVIGFVIFIIGSALCGMSISAGLLIGFRAFQASGAAILFANSPAILTQNFPSNRRGQALGLQASMTYFGLTVGPSLGGWLAYRYTWRVVFYINIPIGILALILSLRFIPKEMGLKRENGFDLKGALVFLFGLVALLLGLNQGSHWGWGSWRVQALLACSASVLFAFFILEKRSSSPMLDLSLFRGRIFSSSAVAAVFNYISLYSIMFLMPFYLIQGRGLNTSYAGFVLTAQPIVMAVAAPISGALSDRIGSRLPATLGMAILSTALLLLAFSGKSTPLRLIAASLALAGLGTGMFISPNTSALMGDAPRNRQGIAAGVLAISRNVGMVLGVGIAGAILTSKAGNGGGAELYSAVDTGFGVASGFAAMASIVSLFRGKDKHDRV